MDISSASQAVDLLCRSIPTIPSSIAVILLGDLSAACEGAFYLVSEKYGPHWNAVKYGLLALPSCDPRQVCRVFWGEQFPHLVSHLLSGAIPWTVKSAILSALIVSCTNSENLHESYVGHPAASVKEDEFRRAYQLLQFFFLQLSDVRSVVKVPKEEDGCDVHQISEEDVVSINRLQEDTCLISAIQLIAVMCHVRERRESTTSGPAVAGWSWAELRGCALNPDYYVYAHVVDCVLEFVFGEESLYRLTLLGPPLAAAHAVRVPTSKPVVGDPTLSMSSHEPTEGLPTLSEVAEQIHLCDSLTTVGAIMVDNRSYLSRLLVECTLGPSFLGNSQVFKLTSSEHVKMKAAILSSRFAFYLTPLGRYSLSSPFLEAYGDTLPRQLPFGRDVFIFRAFSDGPALFDLLDVVSCSAHALVRLKHVVASLLAALVVAWHGQRAQSSGNAPVSELLANDPFGVGNEVLSTLDSDRLGDSVIVRTTHNLAQLAPVERHLLLEMTTRLLGVLRRSGWLPPPLCWCAELFADHVITPDQVALVLHHSVWSFLRDHSGMVHAGPSCWNVLPPLGHVTAEHTAGVHAATDDSGQAAAEMEEEGRARAWALPYLYPIRQILDLHRTGLADHRRRFLGFDKS